MSCCLVCRQCSETMTADLKRALAYQEERSTQRAERIAELEAEIERLNEELQMERMSE